MSEVLDRSTLAQSAPATTDPAKSELTVIDRDIHPGLCKICKAVAG